MMKPLRTAYIDLGVVNENDVESQISCQMWLYSCPWNRLSSKPSAEETLIGTLLTRSELTFFLHSPAASWKFLISALSSAQESTPLCSHAKEGKTQETGRKADSSRITPLCTRLASLKGVPLDSFAGDTELEAADICKGCIGHAPPCLCCSEPPALEAEGAHLCASQVWSASEACTPFPETGFSRSHKVWTHTKYSFVYG